MGIINNVNYNKLQSLLTDAIIHNKPYTYTTRLASAGTYDNDEVKETLVVDGKTYSHCYVLY